MPAPAWEDLGDFLNVDDFATVATLKLQTGGTREVTGIFDEPYLNAQIGEYEADTSVPRFTCRASDVVGVQRGDVITVDDQAYDILTSPQPDGTGMALLKLAPSGRL